MGGERGFSDPGIDDEVEATAEALLELARDMGRVILVSEERSELGRFEHCATVQRRIRDHEPGATELDGHFLLTEEAYEEELAMAARARRNGG